jgi:hypothetical protein
MKSLDKNFIVLNRGAGTVGGVGNFYNFRGNDLVRKDGYGEVGLYVCER